MSSPKDTKAGSTTDMYPPPAPTELEKLSDGLVETVCFGQYVIHLSFDNGNRLSFSAPFRSGPIAALSESDVIEFPVSKSNLMQLIGNRVTKIECETDGTLHLQFSNDFGLIVYANDPMYEAYTLLISGKEYVV